MVDLDIPWCGLPTFEEILYKRFKYINVTIYFKRLNYHTFEELNKLSASFVHDKWID